MTTKNAIVNISAFVTFDIHRRICNQLSNKLIQFAFQSKELKEKKLFNFHN